MPPNKPNVRRRLLPPKLEAPMVFMQLDRLPPLPQIIDPEIHQLSVTHVSYIPRSAGTDHSRELQTYKRLEWLGDSWLSHFVSNHLLQLFPNALTGTLQAVRGVLLSNCTLAYIARNYDLHSDMRMPPKLLEYFENLTMEHLSDLMEARVGGIVQEANVNGRSLKELEDWARATFSNQVFPEMGAFVLENRVERRRGTEEDKSNGPSEEGPPRKKSKPSKLWEGEVKSRGMFGRDGEELEYLSASPPYPALDAGNLESADLEHLPQGL